MSIKAEHGVWWLSWVVIIFGLGLIVFFVGFFDNFMTVLGGFGYNVTDNTQHAMFWALVSLWFLMALRGAKIEVKERDEH